MAIEYFQIKEKDFDLVEQVLDIEGDTYEDSGLDIFDLIAMLRHGRVYVAVEKENVIGVVYFMRSFDDTGKAFLQSINIVDPGEYPNLAKSLLEVTFADMQSFGIKTVEVSCDPSNFRALKIYREELGFVASDSLQSDLLDGEELLMLQKDL